MPFKLQHLFYLLIFMVITTLLTGCDPDPHPSKVVLEEAEKEYEVLETTLKSFESKPKQDTAELVKFSDSLIKLNEQLVELVKFKVSVGSWTERRAAFAKNLQSLRSRYSVVEKKHYDQLLMQAEKNVKGNPERAKQILEQLKLLSETKKANQEKMIKIVQEMRNRDSEEK
jgi:hypothetical protein